jgi:hypothetical protein
MLHMAIEKNIAQAQPVPSPRHFREGGNGGVGSVFIEVIVVRPLVAGVQTGDMVDTCSGTS